MRTTKTSTPKNPTPPSDFSSDSEVQGLGKLVFLLFENAGKLARGIFCGLQGLQGGGMEHFCGLQGLQGGGMEHFWGLQELQVKKKGAFLLLHEL